ncbi:hypothetical protein SAMN04488009_3522 [Maribacter sedimenticola]|uniref:Uncharacterized protein n=1 Tax=Maribacter sedimenticola TaxID=228956 RepID=A0ABY1SL59_9FLAO|nr:hypothetical protein SAMN04488009_3522 [Maribacter sedimenticola]
MDFVVVDKSEIKKLHTTKPKRNPDFRVKPKGLGIFIKSLN